MVQALLVGGSPTFQITESIGSHMRDYAWRGNLVTEMEFVGYVDFRFDKMGLMELAS